MLRLSLALLLAAAASVSPLAAASLDDVDPADVAAVEAEVKAHYELYDPEKLAKLNTIMFRYKGREAELISDLKEKYKDAPLASEKKQQQGQEEEPAKELTVAEEITALYKQHNPEKLDKVPGLLEKYKGAEAKLLRTIQEKYGVEVTEPPPPPADPPPPPAEPFMYEGEGTMIEVTDNLYTETIKPDRSNLWVVEFFAPWCGHCKNIKPEYSRLAKELQTVEGVKVAACDATVHTTVANVAKVQSYPTFAFFKNGRVIEYKPAAGATTEREKVLGIANTAFKKAKKFLKGCRRDPEMVPDPESIKPRDWDDEEDGPWAPELIKNPICESQAKTAMVNLKAGALPTKPAAATAPARRGDCGRADGSVGSRLLP